MPIKVWDYLDELEAEKKEILQAIDTVFKSGQLILGDQVKAFEKEFAQFCGAKFGVGVNSGTDALFLGLRALGIGPGMEVLTVPNTAVPTVAAIVATGAIPRLVDVDEKTLLMDVSQIDNRLTAKTKCLLPVHLFGQCVDMEALQNIARKHKLVVLEDCAQSHGARIQKKMAGSFGDAAAFSFYPTKILGGYGDGGMVVTDQESVNKKLKRLRFYGMEETYYALEDGYNSRLDELHAAILLKKLQHLPEYLEQRRRHAKAYVDLLSGTELVLPVTASGNTHAYYLFVVRHPKRDRILEELKKVDIQLNVSYRWPIHLMPAYQNLGYHKGDFPRAEKAADEIFSLPMYPSLKLESIEKVCAELKKILQRL